jgi:hypothetical protein
MRATRAGLAVVAILGAWGVCAVASAQEAGAKVKVLPLRVSGDRLSAEQAASLSDALVEKLKKYPTLDVLPAPKADAVDIMVDAGCTDLDAACLAEIGSQTGADRVLYTEVGDQGGTPLLQMRFVDVRTKELKAPESLAVAADKLPGAIASSVEKVMGTEPKAEPVAVAVDLATVPAGAEVYVGTDFVGLSPVTVKLLPGQHMVRATKVGYREQFQVVVVEEGRPTTPRTITLPAIPAAVPVAPAVPMEPPAKPEKKAEASPFYKTWWFWTIVGAVVVGGGTAAYLLTRDGGGTGSAGFTPDPFYAPSDVLVIRPK